MATEPFALRNLGSDMLPVIRDTFLSCHHGKHECTFRICHATAGGRGIWSSEHPLNTIGTTQNLNKGKYIYFPSFSPHGKVFVWTWFVLRRGKRDTTREGTMCGHGPRPQAHIACHCVERAGPGPAPSLAVLCIKHSSTIAGGCWQPADTCTKSSKVKRGEWNQQFAVRIF